MKAGQPEVDMNGDKVLGSILSGDAATLHFFSHDMRPFFTTLYGYNIAARTYVSRFLGKIVRVWNNGAPLPLLAVTSLLKSRRQCMLFLIHAYAKNKTSFFFRGIDRETTKDERPHRHHVSQCPALSYQVYSSSSSTRSQQKYSSIEPPQHRPSACVASAREALSIPSERRDRTQMPGGFGESRESCHGSTKQSHSNKQQ